MSPTGWMILRRQETLSCREKEKEGAQARRSAHSLFQDRSKDYREGDFDRIPRQIGDDADEKTFHDAQVHLHAQPCRAEGVGHSHAEHKSGHAGAPPPVEMLGDQSSDYSEEDKADQVAAGGTCEFPYAPRKAGENGETAQAQEQIDDAAGRGLLPTQQKNGKSQHKIGQRQRHRAERDGDGQRCQYTCDSGHKGGEHQTLGGEPGVG